MLSSLACIWGLGNTVAGLIGNSGLPPRRQRLHPNNSYTAWSLLVHFGCEAGSTPETCPKSANMGWRYLYLVIGGLCLVMSLIRAFVLRSKESPRWLVLTGEIDQTVDVLNYISGKNGSDYNITTEGFITSTRTMREIRSLRQNMQRCAGLFSPGKRLQLMLGLIIMWTLIGIAQVFLLGLKQKHIIANTGLKIPLVCCILALLSCREWCCSGKFQQLYHVSRFYNLVCCGNLRADHQHGHGRNSPTVSNFYRNHSCLLRRLRCRIHHGSKSIPEPSVLISQRVVLKLTLCYHLCVIAPLLLVTQKTMNLPALTDTLLKLLTLSIEVLVPDY